MSQTRLPVLYKKTKNGSIQRCAISYVEDNYYTEYGLVDGKQQVNTTICHPTNVGRSNERDATAQAEFEALAQWKHKIKTGYVEDESGELQVQLPMKISTYEKSKHKLDFVGGVTAQYKRNGVNAIYRLVNDELILTSRGAELYPRIPHLEKYVRAMMQDFNTDVLAGELYIHNTHLQDITSYVKAPKTESSNLQFHVFDMPEIKGDRATRYKPNSDYTGFVQLCQNYVVTSEADIVKLHEQALADNYEGLVLYNNSSVYQYNIRSTEVMKYKIPLSKEFKIVDFELDKRNHPVFKLESDGGIFKAKPKMTHEQLSAIVPTSYVGEWATCEYEMLSKSNKPLKPIFISLRKCNDQGEPLE